MANDDAEENMVMRNYSIFLKCIISKIYSEGLKIKAKLLLVNDKESQAYLNLVGQEMAHRDSLTAFFDSANLFLVQYKYLGLQNIDIKKFDVGIEREEFAADDERKPETETFKSVCFNVLIEIGKIYNNYSMTIQSEKRENIKSVEKGILLALKKIVLIIKRELKSNNIKKNELFTEDDNAFIKMFF